MMSIDNRLPLADPRLRPPLWKGQFELGRFVLTLSLKRNTDDEQPPLIIKNRLAALRQERGLSHGELANRLHIRPSTLLALEEGSYLPGLRLAMQLSKFFNMPIEALFSSAGEESQG